MKFGAHNLLVIHFRLKHLGYLQYRCLLCQKMVSSGGFGTKPILKHIASHGGKRTKNSKLDVDVPDAASFIEDLKVTDPKSYPTKVMVEEAIEKARTEEANTSK